MQTRPASERLDFVLIDAIAMLRAFVEGRTNNDTRGQALATIRQLQELRADLNTERLNQSAVTDAPTDHRNECEKQDWRLNGYTFRHVDTGRERKFAANDLSEAWKLLYEALPHATASGDTKPEHNTPTGWQVLNWDGGVCRFKRDDGFVMAVGASTLTDAWRRLSEELATPRPTTTKQAPVPGNPFQHGCDPARVEAAHEFLPKDRDAALRMIAEKLYAIRKWNEDHTPEEFRGDFVDESIDALIDLIERS